MNMDAFLGLQVKSCSVVCYSSGTNLYSDSLVDQTTPSTALDVLHAGGGSGHSGTVSVTQRNAYRWEMHITAYSVVTSVYRYSQIVH